RESVGFCCTAAIGSQCHERTLGGTETTRGMCGTLVSWCRKTTYGGHHEGSPPQIPSSGRWHCPLPAVSRVARAQAYPARTVTIIVPFAAGGTLTVTCRIIGQYMSRVLGQQFIVENVRGAGGTIGSTRAMRVRPDGYTILMGTTATHSN